MADNAPKEFLFGLEVVIEQRPGNAQFVGDLLQARLPEAASAEELGRVAKQDFFARLLDSFWQDSSIRQTGTQEILLMSPQARPCWESRVWMTRTLRAAHFASL